MANPTVLKTRIDLRTILSAGILVVLMLAGATWVVDDDDGGADFTSMQTAEASGMTCLLLVADASTRLTRS